MRSLPDGVLGSGVRAIVGPHSPECGSSPIVPGAIHNPGIKPLAVDHIFSSTHPFSPLHPGLLPMGYSLLADLVVAIHVAYVSFLPFGQLTICAGVVLRWGWVRNFWFRSAHLLAIAIVATEAIFN